MSQPTFTGPKTVPSRLDFFQAVSGVLLILFLWAHLFLVSSVIISPKIMDAIAWFFETTYMAQVGGPIIFLLMFAHFVIAARKMPFRAGEPGKFWAQAKMLHHYDTWMWVVQVVSALVILAMGSIHMYEVLTNLPITAELSAARVQGANGHAMWLPFYLVLLPMAELHVGIGFYRLGCKYGFITRATRPTWHRNEKIMCVGF
ncbi:MAG: succinate dehydrogenase/fumarate reductase cytochrome b subunit, partial [Desulfovibrionaceae bacterium]|nr:succinate dehydrogenase/fumarate reductase cytochrome b subunit [Desulfovibrionaceae bacterium]